MYSYLGICYKGRSILTFHDITTLLRASDDPLFVSVMKTVSCLVMIAETSHSEDIAQLLDMMTTIRVPSKYLMINTSVLDISILRNKTINYEVCINSVGKGTRKKTYQTD